MAFGNLNTAATLWKNSGLKYLYYPDGIPARPDAVSQPAPVNKPRIRPVSSSGANPARDARPLGVSRPNAVDAAPINTVSSSVASRKKWIPLPAEALPDDWRELIAKTKPATVAWTYLELGGDLLSGTIALPEEEKKRVQARRNTLGALLKSLNHPGGTHTFAPLTPGVWNPENYTHDYFFSALKILRCRGLIIFGSAAGEILFPEKNLRPLISWKREDLFVWLLRDLNALGGPENRYYKESALYLANSLRRFVRG